MNFQINLATRYYVNYRKINLLIMLAFALISIWITLNIYTLLNFSEEINRLSGLKAGLAAKSSVKSVSDSDYNKLLASIGYANTILNKRSYDWLNLLDNLEHIMPDGVSLRGLEPSFKGETIKLTGSAKNFASIRRFIEELESSKKFTEIYLTEHSNVKIGNMMKGVNFTVTCKAII